MLPCAAHPPLPHSNMLPRKPKSDEEGITPPIHTRFRHQNIEFNVSDFVRLTWTVSAGRLHQADSSSIFSERPLQVDFRDFRVRV